MTSKMMRIINLFVFMLLVISCSLKGRMEKQEKAKSITDHIMANLNNRDVVELFPEKYFPRKQIVPVIESLNKNCDLNSKKGKYVDFFTMVSNGKNQVAFIYEYILKCDSLRFIYMYDLDAKEPELYKFRIEPLEQKSELVIDPTKQLLYQKK